MTYHSFPLVLDHVDDLGEFFERRPDDDLIVSLTVSDALELEPREGGAEAAVGLRQLCQKGENVTEI